MKGKGELIYNGVKLDLCREEIKKKKPKRNVNTIFVI